MHTVLTLGNKLSLSWSTPSLMVPSASIGDPLPQVAVSSGGCSNFNLIDLMLNSQAV